MAGCGLGLADLAGVDAQCRGGGRSAVRGSTDGSSNQQSLTTPVRTPARAQPAQVGFGLGPGWVVPLDVSRIRRSAATRRRAGLGSTAEFDAECPEAG